MAERASAIYSDDNDIFRYAKQAKLPVYRTIDLKQPPEDPQKSMEF
ncbi:hypothetical protein [Mangrovicoccus ximenensis]|nr:hypothetical protein [Mangrovicoccus ximenensis]